MTDDDTPTESGQHKDPFFIAVSLDAFLQLEERVQAVESAQPAVSDTGSAGPVDDTGLAARLDRHRAEIEALKRWGNDLLEALRPWLQAAEITAPTPPPAAPRQEYQ